MGGRGPGRGPGGPGGGPAGAMGRPVEKAKDFKGTLKRLANYLAPQRTRFLVVDTPTILADLDTPEDYEAGTPKRET